MKPGSPLNEKLALEQARGRLIKDIERFHKNARQYLRAGVLESALSLPQAVSPLGTNWDALEEADEGQGDPTENNARPSDDTGTSEDALPVPEEMVIALPSNLGVDFCKTHGLRPLLTHERKLRIGQMNDALHAIRVGVGYKSYLYRHSVRTATSQRAKLRSFDDVHLANDAVLGSARLYALARAALIKLYDEEDAEDKQALASITSKYRMLAKQDLKANTAIIEHATRGVSNVHLPWFWSVDIEGDSRGSGWMKESGYSLECSPNDIQDSNTAWAVYRVVWLRAHARQTRWEEELAILPIEMACVLKSFGQIVTTWDDRYRSHTSSGHRAFASRQASLWKEMQDHASNVFANAITMYQPPNI